MMNNREVSNDRELKAEKTLEDEISHTDLVVDVCKTVGILSYKSFLDEVLGKSWFPKHVFQHDKHDTVWTDLRTGKSGNIVDLHRLVDKINAEEAVQKILIFRDENLKDGVDVSPGAINEDQDLVARCEDWSFPVESLPSILRSMVEEMEKAEGLSRVLSSMCCIAAISAALGNTVKMESCNGRTVRGNLYMATSARSGTGKSIASDRAFKPIRDFERAYTAKFHREELPILTEQITELRKKLKQEDCDPIAKVRLEAELPQLEAKLEPPILTTMDATSEKLAAMMARNRGAIAMLGGESRSAVDMVGGRYRARGETDENIYLAAYSGDHFAQARIARGVVTIENPCLTFLWMLQPDKFDEMLSKTNLTESGFLCRMLFCISDATTPEVRSFGTKFSPMIEDRYSSLVKQLLTSYRTASNADYTVEMSKAGWQVIIDYKAYSRARAENELNYMNSFVGRWAENAFRLALVFHATSHGSDAHQHEVSEDTAKAAVNVVSWFAYQQVAILMQAVESKEEAVRNKIIEYLARYPSTTARDIARGVNLKSDKIRNVLDELIGEGLLLRENRNGVGRSSVVYGINKGRKRS